MTDKYNNELNVGNVVAYADKYGSSGYTIYEGIIVNISNGRVYIIRKDNNFNKYSVFSDKNNFKDIYLSYKTKNKIVKINKKYDYCIRYKQDNNVNLIPFNENDNFGDIKNLILTENNFEFLDIIDFNTQEKIDKFNDEFLELLI